ncbi:MAG: ATP-binding protein, partial [Sulfolobaceae archaeon]
MLCDVCKINEASVFQSHTKRKLCKKCFMEDIRKRVEDEVERKKLKGKKILVAVSGGKDSIVLTDTLAKILDSSNLIALNIEEGIHGYNRRENIIKLKDYFKQLGVELVLTSFKEDIGLTLDEMVKRSVENKVRISACTFCGGFRRKIMNEFGRKYNVDFVATGHNLDDEAQTIIINLLRGDINRLIRFGENMVRVSEKFVPRVKPLRKIYEWETTTYAYFLGFEFQDTECPYIISRPTLRAKVRELLYEIEEIYPGTLLRIVENFDKIADRVKSSVNITRLS